MSLFVSRQNKYATPLLILALFGGGASCHAASFAEKVRQVIQADYYAADAAASNRNAEGAAAHYGDPTLQANTVQALQRLYTIAVSVQFTSRIVDIQIPADDRDAAIVLVFQHFQGMIKVPETGKTALATSDIKVREFWVRTNTGWIAMKSRALSIYRTLNSKPVRVW